MRCAFLRRSALGKPEVADAGAPIEAGRGLVVLVRVVERAVVHRIDCEITVIAPAIGGGALAAGAVEKMLLTRQGIQWIRRQSACVTDLWVNGAAGCAKAQGDVALVIGAIPPIQRQVVSGWYVLCWKIDPVSRLRASQFEPADSRHRIGTYRIVIEQRLMTVGEPAIGVTEHQPIGNGVRAWRWCRFEVHSCELLDRAK